ncbi:POT family-domain-containing protein [Roridomyces roridus]|uniref:POT family-domain-containing protein n=1 Tax=Roridomyces roridus TaxID=1738132 RepID=A0AAD7BBZ6_9AGAR|nr:POT family-domain-containing protein [Roridomyces roridus]
MQHYAALCSDCLPTLSMGSSKIEYTAEDAIGTKLGRKYNGQRVTPPTRTTESVEAAERFSFYGSSVVFTNFLQQRLPAGSHTGAGGADGHSGATSLLSWVRTSPMLISVISTPSALPSPSHWLDTLSSSSLPSPGVIEHSQSALGVFVLAEIIMGFGTGLFKANISPLVAEQYRRTKLFISTTRSGERVIVDPAMTVSRVYMYFYLFINIGALAGQISMAYAEKYVGFWLSYTLPTIVFLFCPLVLLVARKRYIRSPPTGSVLALALHAFGYAAKGKWSWNPVTTVRNIGSADFWEAAKPSRVQGERPAWMTFDDLWVDELKRGLSACWVFCWYPIYWLTYNQLNNNLVSQAATMTTHSVPSDVISNLDPFALIIFIPITDQLLYPALQGMDISPRTPITAASAPLHIPPSLLAGPSSPRHSLASPRHLGLSPRPYCGTTDPPPRYFSAH